MKKLRHFLVIVALFFVGTAFAQESIRIEIAGVGARQIPIAIAPFQGETASKDRMSLIIKSDLARSGLFRIVDTLEVLAEDAMVNYDSYRNQGADALAVGSVKNVASGRYEVRYKLHDTSKKDSISSYAVNASDKSMRLAAHKIADDIYEKLTGIKGIFSTRVAYITKAGKEYRLEVADADGQNRQVALRSNEPIISPSWSPDGTKVAYVSFEAKKPVVYVQNLVTRQRVVIANHKGSNSAPSWSPDGSKLAVALAKDGGTQVYIVNANGTGLQRITSSKSISTEPQFSADGQSIYFTSDRSGGPQIYKVGLFGGAPQRITFTGAYNISPRISPDGKQMAFVSRRSGTYQVYIMDLDTRQEMRLSDGVNDESPSFSPNGKYIMYAKGQRGALGVVSTDGLVKQNITMQAHDIREPSWGPFMP